MSTCINRTVHVCDDQRSFMLQWAVGVMLATLVVLISSLPLHAMSDAHIAPRSHTEQPSGFVGLCKKYSWVCTDTQEVAFTEEQMLKLARQVNTNVNKRVREVEDLAQYGTDEYWTLPTARGGDCEDIVLLKKKLLVEGGMSSSRLLMATVLDRRMNSHAVLVLRTASGDHILDNLNNRIIPWNRTGYTFLKMQDPASLNNWNSVLAGGIAG
jgi:predicted transglutaminase-like cysteine proteinase